MLDLNKNGKDDIQEVADGIKSFIADEASLITNDVKEAGAWLLGELQGLPDLAQQYFSAVVAKVSSGNVGSLGEQVADALTLLYNDGVHAAAGLDTAASAALKSISSAAVTAAVGLTGQKS